MKALELAGGVIRLVERADPEQRAGEAQVRVLLAGICSTDLQLRAGYMGFEGVLGHEFVGEVEQAPTAPELVGRTVVGEINAGCGKAACPDCAAGDPRHCPGRTVLGILGRDGAFAERLSLPVQNLHVVPEGLSLERAVFAEPVAAAFEITEQLDVAGRSALVVGCGKLGSLCARVLRLAGAEVCLSARNPASATLLERDGLPLLPATAEQQFDVVVEATGSPGGLEAAIPRVRPRGTLVLKSTCAASAAIDWTPVVVHELTVVGSRCGPFAPALQALARGEIAPEESVAGCYPLEQFEAAFEQAERPADPARRKLLLSPSGHP